MDQAPIGVDSDAYRDAQARAQGNRSVPVQRLVSTGVAAKRDYSVKSFRVEGASGISSRTLGDVSRHSRRSLGGISRNSSCSRADSSVGASPAGMDANKQNPLINDV